MAKFPVDASPNRVVKALNVLGFRLVREQEHIAMVRENPDGTRTPLTMPNHSRIKGSTLRTICTQAGISRDEFLKFVDSGQIGAHDQAGISRDEFLKAYEQS